MHHLFLKKVLQLLKLKNLKLNLKKLEQLLPLNDEVMISVEEPTVW